jgi:DNA gyrase subunit B
LYGIKKGKKIEYLKNDAEFTREVLRRATDSVVIESGGQAIEGAEARKFLTALDELQQAARRCERRLRDSRVVELLTNPSWKLDTKADFQDRANLEPLHQAILAAKVEAELAVDEEHSAFVVKFRDVTKAERLIGTAFATLPEYRRVRALSKQVALQNVPPFKVSRDGKVLDTKETWQQVLQFCKDEGMRDANVQRYKGLGEMNSDQLWETTMDAEKRTLLRVDLKDLVETDEIFSTLMGEDVENRRKFIEENALDVRNLDV